MTVKCERTIADKNRKSLAIVQRRGPWAFRFLVDVILQNDLNRIANILLSNVSDRPQNTMRSTTQPNVTPYNGTDRQDRDSLVVTPQNRPIQEAASDSTSKAGNTTKYNIRLNDRIAVALTLCGHTLTFFLRRKIFFVCLQLILQELCKAPRNFEVRWL